MKREEIYKELQMSYNELQQYLLKKYGGAVCDYFATPECRSKSKKISRTSEGLYCHHMDEDKGGNLGNASQARLQPYEWQRKERLVYCNILEHLILHIKIAVLRQKDFLKKPDDVISFFTTGGIFMLCEEVNEMFIKDGTSVAWRKRCYEEIKDNYEEYIILINTLLSYIDLNYVGKKDEVAIVVQGGRVSFSDCDCEILQLDRKKDTLLLRTPVGDVKKYKFYDLIGMFNYVDYIDKVTRDMSSTFEEFYENIYEDIIGYNKKDEIIRYVDFLKIDRSGDLDLKEICTNLDDSYSETIDLYISNALPMYCDMSYELEGKSVKVWSGSKIPIEAKETFYIIRIETMFNIKEGCEPFVRYREKDLLRNNSFFGLDTRNGFKTRNYMVLSTSDVYDKKTDKYYSKYYDKDGRLVDATVVLTLGKDDYLLFQERYDIRYMKVLDGCYFC